MSTGEQGVGLYRGAAGVGCGKEAGGGLWVGDVERRLEAGSR